MLRFLPQGACKGRLRPPFAVVGLGLLLGLLQSACATPGGGAGTLVPVAVWLDNRAEYVGEADDGSLWQLMLDRSAAEPDGPLVGEYRLRIVARGAADALYRGGWVSRRADDGAVLFVFDLDGRPQAWRRDPETCLVPETAAGSRPPRLCPPVRTWGTPWPE